MFGIFLDLETNGLSPRRHRILDVAICIQHLLTGKLLGSYESIVQQPTEIWKESDPESLVINGFTWEMSKLGKSETTVSEEVQHFLQTHSIHRNNAIFICQNPSFDRIFFTQLISAYTQESLQWPYHWLDLASMHWARLNLLEKNIQGPSCITLNLSKNQIAEHYNLPKEEMPHRAMNGVHHLMDCYRAVIGFAQGKQ